MSRLLGLVFWTALVLYVACWWRYDHFTPALHASPELAQEPKQVPTREQAFSVEQGGVHYWVNPRFDYDLYGLVVSLKHHDGRFALHRLWNDNLNVADLCVVWGRNAATLDLNAFSFRNAEFTCYFETHSESAWRAFVPAQMANNHLLVTKDYLRDDIMEAEIGDQIHVKGQLAEYGNDTGFSRGTSTIRTDTGNGACETIWVQSFSVLEHMPSIWRTLYTPAWLVALLAGVAWLVGVGRGAF